MKIKPLAIGRAAASRARLPSSKTFLQLVPPIALLHENASELRPDVKPPRLRGPNAASQSISMAEAESWDAAVRHAIAIGCEPNLHITIHWDCSPGPLSVPKRMDKLRNKASQWLHRRTGLPAVWAQVREMGSGANGKGDHIHKLVWVPEPLHSEFRSTFRGWVEADGVRKPGSQPLKIQRVLPGQILTTDKLDGLQSYLMKEGDADVVAKFVHPNHIARRTGLAVPGKRTRVALSIDQAARHRSSGRVDLEPKATAGCGVASLAA